MATASKKAVVSITAVVADRAEKLDEILTRDGSTGGSVGVHDLVNLLAGCAGGVTGAKVLVSIDELTPGTSAAGADAPRLVLTFNNSDITTNDAVFIGPTQMVCKTTATLANASEDNFLKGANATATANNFAAKVNAHSVLSSLVTATAALTKVTLEASALGAFGRIGVAASDVSGIGFGSDETAVEAYGRLAPESATTTSAVGKRTYILGIR